MIAEYNYQLKFVIDSTADCDLVDDYLQEFPEIDQQRVYLMPQGVTQEELAEKSTWLEPICQLRGWHFCPRMQIQWFGLSQGT